MEFKFKDVFTGAQSALHSSPEKAVATFSAHSRLGDGVDSSVSTRQFTIKVGEPAGLGGTDTAPNPVEYILAALGSCQEITYRLYADALGIPVRSVSVKLEGEIDLRGLFNVDASIRPGFRNIFGTVTIDSTASEVESQRLKDTVDQHCPVLDILKNPVPVSLELHQNLAAASLSDARI
ncbi:OsmC family protein [Mesorhizobium sp.]|uniref:OsmC family protein n=1 Tax=Mesorhizobium sp. TaxID=1871066 RepID=UPI0012052A55|nr:OsmC family protein [Mesorhizobium sp.]TIO67748.1 MAG: OsmC family protein [Mesorhizobium sp.]